MNEKRLFEFRVYCNVEQAYLTTWEEAEPAACPHNAAHALDHSKTLVIDSIISGSIEASIREEALESNTGGRFRCRTFQIAVPALADPAPFDISWPYPVSIMAGTYFPPEASIGDEVDVLGAPDTVIGALVATEPAGETVLAVSPTVLDNAFPGAWAKVADQDVGEIRAVDKIAGTITVSVALDADRSPGDLIRMTTKFADRLRLNSVDAQTIGDTKIGSTFLPANRVLRIV